MAGQVLEEEMEALSDINVVPLTDVMLVLLIVFLIAVPVIKQTVPVTLPKVRYEPTTTKPENVSLSVRNGPGGTCEVYWGLTKVNQKDQPPPPIEPTKNVVVVTAQGQILWNGTPVTQDQLRQYLDVTQQMNPVPELHLQPEASARYELVDEVLAVTKRAHVQKMGFVGNEYYMNIF